MLKSHDWVHQIYRFLSEIKTEFLFDARKAKILCTNLLYTNYLHVFKFQDLTHFGTTPGRSIDAIELGLFLLNSLKKWHAVIVRLVKRLLHLHVIYNNKPHLNSKF